MSTFSFFHRRTTQPVEVSAASTAKRFRRTPRHSLPERLSLADLPVRVDAWVDALQMDALQLEGDAEERALLVRLVEIGFVPGQPVRVVARAAGGGDPIAVRVGRSTFALRRGEATLIQVRRTPTMEGQAA